MPYTTPYLFLTLLTPATTDGAQWLNSNFTAVADAITLKAPLASPTFTGTVAVPAMTINGASLSISGATVLGSSTNNLSILTTGNTSVTLPTSGTLLTSATQLISSVATGTGLSLSGSTLLFDASLYAPNIGSSFITTVGAISAGTWHGSTVGPIYGGTGVNNGSSTITLGGNLTTSGAFATTLTVTNTTNATLPAGTTTLLATNGSGASLTGLTESQITNLTGHLTTVKGITIDGGGSVITTGVVGSVQIPFNSTVTGWKVVSQDGTSGSITFDVQTCSLGSGVYTNTSGNSIIGSTGSPVHPNLTSQITNSSTSFTNWTSTTLTAGQYLVFVVTGTPSSVLTARIELTLAPR